MITETKNIHIERNNIGREASFKMEANAHIMKILRDGIYSNKILACIREYSTNAMEAHKLNGNESVPIEVTLPNIIDPMLKIRDFGPGLSFEQIHDLICSYGATTKDKSNDFVGCFGIGSKAAFSYTNTFQITSICNGSKLIFNAYIDETEIGKISELFHGPALDGEKSGIEIAIPIHLNDITKLIEEARNFYRFWDLPPIIKGVGDYQPVINEWLLKNKANTWGFLKKEGYYERSYVVMGGVFYHIFANSIPNVDGIHRNILDKSVVIYANIGDVTIAANREQVSYTQKTINFVKSALRKIEEEAKKEIDDAFSKCTTEYQARELYYHYFRGGKMGSIITQLFHHEYDAKFGDISIRTQSFPEDNLRMNGIARFYLRHSRGNTPMRSNHETHFDVFNNLKDEEKPKKGVNFYYIGDKNDSLSYKLLKYYLKQENSNSFTCNNCVINFKTEQDKLDWCAEKGIPDDTFRELTSTIVIPVKPKQPRKPREKNPKTNCAVFDPKSTILGKTMQYFDHSGWYYHDVDLDEVTGGYYVIKHYSNLFLDKEAKERNSYEDQNYVGEVIEMLGDISDEFNTNPVIYAFTESEIEKLKDNPNWISLKDLAKDELQYQHDKFDTSLIPIGFHSFTQDGSMILRLINDGLFSLASNNRINELISYFDFTVGVKEIQPYLDLTSILKIDSKSYDRNIIAEMSELITEEAAKYPLLPAIRYYQEIEHNEIAIYLNAKQLQLEEKIAQEAEKILTWTPRQSNLKF